jgi:hypothetical protein
LITSELLAAVMCYQEGVEQSFRIPKRNRKQALFKFVILQHG